MVKRARHLPQPATIHLVIYVVSLLALLFVSFHNLGANAIADFDEARHAVNAYEMMRDGNYLVNTYMGDTDLWNLKPPLGYWTVMVGYALFGYTSFGLRFASAVCWMLIAVLLSGWLRKRSGIASSICFILLMIASTRLYQAHLVRSGDADAVFTLLCVLELLFLIKAKDSKWMVLPAGLCVGLAFLAKSWHAFWMFPATLLFLIISGMLPRFSARHVFGYFLAAFAPIVLWGIARYSADGSAFFKTMVEYDLLARSGTALEGHHGGPEYYIKVLLLTPSAVASALILFAGAVYARIRKDEEEDTELLSSKDPKLIPAILSWTLTPIVLFSIVSTKLVWYVFPCVPVLCFTAAYIAPDVWGAILRIRAIRTPRAAIAPMACLVIAGAFVVFGMSVSYRNTQDIKTDDEQDLLESAYEGGDLPQGAEFYFWDGWGDIAPQGVVARAELSGDAMPLQGGAPAFASTDSPAVLLIDEEAMEDLERDLPSSAELVGRNDQFLLYSNGK